FADEAAWQAWLAGQGVTAERLVRIAAEGALPGCPVEQGVSRDLVVLSGGAGPFDVPVRASCRAHAGRPLARVVPHGEAHRRAIELVRWQVWELYRDLEPYQRQPGLGGAGALRDRSDSLAGQQTGSPGTGGVPREMAGHEADLPRVPRRPGVPPHDNGTGRDIRAYAKERKVGGGTRGAAGRRRRDTFASLKKTCRELGVCFWNYLRGRAAGPARIPRRGA